MSKRLFLFALFVIHCSLFTSFAQSEEDVFDGNTMLVYEKACSLNEAKDYLEAYRQMVLAERAIDATLQKKGINASALSDYEFLYRYWPVKKSKAEIAYMLCIYTDMETVSNELRQILENKKWEDDDDDTSDAIVNGLWADLAKIDGSRYYLTEQYDLAETALKRALSLKAFDNRFICPVYGDLAQLYYKQEHYDQALTQLDLILANPLYRNDSRERETERNIQEVRSQRAICLARLNRYAEALQEIEPVVSFFKYSRDKRSYAEALRKKAKILMLQYDTTDKYSPAAKTCYQEYLGISKDFIDSQFVRMSESEREQYWMAEQPFVTDCFRLEDKAPAMLYDVALFSKAVLLQMGRDFKSDMTEAQKKKALSAIRIDWRRVREKMPASSVAIEFISYEKVGEDHLAALVLAKNATTPVFVDIVSLNELKQLKLEGNLSVETAICSTAHENKNSLYTCEQLSSMIWNKQLVKAIGQNQKIYFAPDGIFHQLAIEYILPEGLKSKKLYRLTSTRLLAELNRKICIDKMLMCGGVDYAVDSPSSAMSGNDEKAYSIMSGKGMGLAYLNGSKAEVDSIEALRYNKADMVLRADSVTETAIRELMNKYHLILISTHGYFAEAATMGTDIRPAMTDTQLSQSCLFLSGAEKNMRNRQFDATQPDGILSARELAGMDLSDVDLVTLSACQSGLGYVTIDGVFGLQRGLKSAGVRAVIASLWEVDDQATITLMKTLYANLEKGQTLHEAFFNARHTLETTVVEKIYPRKGVADLVVKKQYDKPQFFDAFILIDGI